MQILGNHGVYNLQSSSKPGGSGGRSCPGGRIRDAPGGWYQLSACVQGGNLLPAPGVCVLVQGRGNGQL